METNSNIERAYDLIEQFEFHELTEADKMYILSVMTEAQYLSMRRTIIDAKAILESDIEPIFNIPQSNNHKGKSKLLRLANYPVQLYKVAASIVIIMVIYFMVQKSAQNHTNQLITRNDTIFIYKIDTVYTKIDYTARIIKNDVHSTQGGIKPGEYKVLATHSNLSFDCSKELCPGEVGRIVSMNNKNDIISDSALNGLLVKLN